MPKCVPVKKFPAFRCNGGDVYVRQDEHRAVIETPNTTVTCHGVLASRFGWPNDEALSGHPYYEDGLKRYDCVEVLDSPWLKEINEMNRKAFPNFKGYTARHFFMSFHDSSFEVLCDEITFPLGTVKKAVANILKPQRK